MGFIKGFIALFVLVALLVYLAPGEGFRKYIRFFSEILLTLGFLSPALSLFFDSDEFLERIQYEEFTENLAEISSDVQKMEFLQGDYYLAEYERAIEADVAGIAEQQGFTAVEVDVHLTEDYVLDAISLSVAEQGQGEISVGEIRIGGGETGAGQEEEYAGLKRELSEYYQIEEAQVQVRGGS